MFARRLDQAGYWPRDSHCGLGVSENKIPRCTYPSDGPRGTTKCTRNCGYIRANLRLLRRAVSCRPVIDFCVGWRDTRVALEPLAEPEPSRRGRDARRIETATHQQRGAFVSHSGRDGLVQQFAAARDIVIFAAVYRRRVEIWRPVLALRITCAIDGYDRTARYPLDAAIECPASFLQIKRKEMTEHDLVNLARHVRQRKQAAVA